MSAYFKPQKYRNYQFVPLFFILLPKFFLLVLLMLTNCILNICFLIIQIEPIAVADNAGYIDLVTLLFSAAILVLTLVVAANRRKFNIIIQSLFSQRVRGQFIREIKLFNSWIDAILLVYIFMVQALLLFLLLQYFLPGIARYFSPIALYGISFGVVIVDYFLKMLNVFILSYLFEYKEERMCFNHNKFFYLTVNSVLLLPILIVTVYTGIKLFLFVYLLVFLITYAFVIYKTIILYSKSLSRLQFFLYFCTLEILPYMVCLKVLINLNNVLI